MDDDVFSQALQTYEEKLEVLTAPSDMVPLDLITPEDIERVIEIARRRFDYVVVDMPTTLVHWSETVLQAAHVYFAMIELDMRSAQNALRLKRAMFMFGRNMCRPPSGPRYAFMPSKISWA